MSAAGKIFLGILASFAGLIVLVLLIVWGVYNGFVSSRNAVDKAWSDVEAAYQRRLDTIPRFVQVAKFSVEFQRKLAIEYAKAREGVRQAASSGDPGALQKKANDGYNALLIAVRQEAVPQARTDQLTELNAQIENVERVINHQRNAFNESVFQYNTRTQTFPGNMIAGSFGFLPRKGFKAAEGAERAPDFNLKLD